MQTSHHLNGGFTTVSVLLALSLLAAMSASILAIVAKKQSTRKNLLQSSQAFYIDQAALEYAMQQILADGNPNPIPVRNFLGSQTFNISRTCGKISVNSTYYPGISFSVTDPGQVCPTSSTATPNSNSSTFNGQSIPQGTWIWFNASLNFTGAGTGIAHIYAKNSTITFTANSVNYNIPIPDAIITIDPNVSCVSAAFTSSNLWMVRTPPSQNGNVFMSGVGFQVPVDLPGSISPVIWTTTVAADQVGLSVKWAWGAAVYTTSLADLKSLGVKASDKTTCNDSSNAKVATPQNVTSYHTNGARCGGGADYACEGGGVSSTIVSCLTSC